MNRVTKRTWLMGLFVLILVGGMVFFVVDYWHNASDWIASPGSPHVSNRTNIGVGTITDRSGAVLLDMGEKRTYSSNESTRKSTLHWVGDRQGKISAGAVTSYAGAMVGFDPVNGIYNSEDTAGVTTLTLSERVQNTALEALAGRKGTVAVYNYKTGEILCAVTSPSFDPDNVPDIDGDTTGKYEGIYLNRFIQSSYVPGSIFKVVTTAAALECVPGIQEESFLCTGTVEYGSGSNIATVTCENAHGTVNLKSALAKSCNCAFAKIAEKIGKENMMKCVKQFQIADALQFDGVTTSKGKYDLTGAASASFAWSCIGQHSDLINPARFMTFMGAIAGGGKAAEPYVVANVTCAGEVTYEAETSMTEQLMSREIAETLKAYMRSNVKNGYGDGNFGGLSVCAKTGTSQLGGEAVSNAMFAGFVADENYPLAFISVVENAGYGASAALPVAAKVLSVCAQVMDRE